MLHAASKIEVRLAAAASLCALVCCQQLLGLDEGKTVAAGTGGGAQTTAGSSATGGASSSASSSSTSGGSCAGAIAVAAADLIDDMEEGAGSIIKQGGRSGSWFTYNDGTAGGTQTPAAGGPCLPVAIPGGRCASAHAMHTYGAGFTNYGVGIGFDLNHPSGTRMPYDVSAFTGIAFWGRGPQIVEVQVVEQATAPVKQGGTCAGNCGDHYFLAVNLSAEWQEIVVPFSMLKQQGWGTAAAWDPKSVMAVQFAVNPAPMFDYWIDDIGFY